MKDYLPILISVAALIVSIGTFVLSYRRDHEARAIKFAEHRYAATKRIEICRRISEELEARIRFSLAEKAPESFRIHLARLSDKFKELRKDFYSLGDDLKELDSAPLSHQNILSTYKISLKLENLMENLEDTKKMCVTLAHDLEKADPNLVADLNAIEDGRYFTSREYAFSKDAIVLDRKQEAS